MNIKELKDLQISFVPDNDDNPVLSKKQIERLKSIQTDILSESESEQSKKTFAFVESFSDAADSIEDEVILLNDDSYYGSGDTVSFVKAPNELTRYPELKRNSGDYIMPKPRKNAVHSDVPTISIGEVIGSYINRSDLIYGNNNTLFSTECTNEIDCSSFAQAVYQGISYDNSRYAGLKENKCGYYTSDSIAKNPASTYFVQTKQEYNRPLGYRASEQAMWFAQRNRLFYIDYDKEDPVSQLQTGDLIFESDIHAEAYDTSPNTYLYISHVMVVINVYPESGMITVAQAGQSSVLEKHNQPQRSEYNFNVCKITSIPIAKYPEKFLVFARPDYLPEERKPISVLDHTTLYEVTVTPEQSNRKLADIYLNRKLDKNKFYTLKIKGKLPDYFHDEGLRINFWITSPKYNSQMCIIKGYDITDHFLFGFVPLDNADTIDKIIVQTYKNERIKGTYQYKIDEIELFEGLLPNRVYIGE